MADAEPAPVPEAAPGVPPGQAGPKAISPGGSATPAATDPPSPA
jgi:hypothetical protein